MKCEERRQYFELAEKLIAEQNLRVAIVAGAATTILAAGIYGVVTSVWSYSYGFVAVGIGISIGFTMQYLGRGITTKFVVLASCFTVFGCLLGNLIRAAIKEAQTNFSSLIEVFHTNSAATLASWAFVDLGLVDLVYLFIAIWCATFFVRRPLSRKEELAVHIYEMKL